MDPVVHFEMGYNDKQHMVDFYTKAFGWKAQMMGPEMGNYVLAQTTPTDDKGMVQTPGNINGGFYAKTDSPTSQAPSVVISVKDIRESMKKVEAAGENSGRHGSGRPAHHGAAGNSRRGHVDFLPGQRRQPRVPAPAKGYVINIPCLVLTGD